MKDERIRQARAEELRWTEARLRQEMETLRRKEKEKLEALKKQSEAWHESQKLRAFLHAACQSRPSIDPESPFAKWLIWANQQADCMDPLKMETPLILDDGEESSLNAAV